MDYVRKKCDVSLACDDELRVGSDDESKLWEGSAKCYRAVCAVCWSGMANVKRGTVHISPVQTSNRK